MEASDRPQQAQHLSTCRKVQTGNSASLIPGEWVSSIDLSDAYLHVPIHQNSRKYLTQSLGWIINQEKSELKHTRVFSFVGYEYHLDSAIVNPLKRAQSSGFDHTLKVKTCFDCKMFAITNWVARLNVKDDPGGTPSPEALSVLPQGALEIFQVIGQPPSLVRDQVSSPRVMAKSCKCDEGCRPSPQDHSIQIFTDAANELGALT